MAFSYGSNSSARLRRRLSLLALVSSITMGVSSHAQLPSAQHYSGVEYLTGGFGLEESSAIKEVMNDYPLALTFVSSGGGRSAYVSQVQVVVRDAHDATVLNVESQGPFLLARLSAGTYQVFATYLNQTQSQSVTITDGNSSRALFDWPRRDNTQKAESVDMAPDHSDRDAESASDSRFVPGTIPGVD